MTWENQVKEVWLVAWLAVWTWWDLRYQLICRWQIILVVVTGLLWQGIVGNLFTAAVLGGLALGAAAWGFSMVTGDRFGRGDAMVILCLGLYQGFGNTLSLLMWGLMAASMVSLYLLWVKKRSRDQSIPFIPCLMLGYLIHWGILWIAG